MVVLTLTGREIDWQAAKKPDPNMLVQWIPDHGSIPETYKGSLRTCAHQDQMDNRAFVRFGVGIHVMQTPYNVGFALSKGTHDRDACKDWRINGVDWWVAQRFGRECGEGVWFRHTGSWASPPAWHNHGFTLPLNRRFATKVGEYVDGGVSLTGRKYTSSQLDDYYNHSLGLKGQHVSGLDTSWFPKNIDDTIFDLNHYIFQQKEKDMQYEDWTPKSRKMLVDDVVAGIMGAKVTALDGQRKPKQITVRNALARAANGLIVTRQSEADVIAAVEAADNDN